ncbi:serine hydrolase domain-containing protein [Kitasatospora sp. HPMI-4]|uniref:serine hydrolase domain-containing protein n=1 Tax=Kitasatospora sp. HPMI-4 TaxID=3448443 RepID=UPI003F1CB0A3
MADHADLARRTAEELALRGGAAAVAVVTADRIESAAAGGAGPATVFEIGSVTKVFTALALARLVVSGTVALDEPLADVLGAAVPARGRALITLRQLAMHTSGLPRLPRGMLWTSLLRGATDDPYARCTADRLLARLPRTRLSAAPGQRFRYSNLGAGLLGLALARRSSTDYATLVDRQLVRPLGLTRTGPDVPGLAQGHDRHGRPAPPWNLADLAGAGGLRATATDLARFVRAHLRPDTTDLAAAIRLARCEERHVAEGRWVHLGWFEQRHPDPSRPARFWHNGGTGGSASFVAFTPDLGVGVVVLSAIACSVDGPALELLRSAEISS